MESDTYVEVVPKLSVLAADVLAPFSTSIMSEEWVEWGGGKHVYCLREDVAALPLPVSEALLNSFRRNRRFLLLRPKVLSFFINSTKTPLLNLDLEGSVVDNETLFRLLASHRRNLLYVNLTECTSLTEGLHTQAQRIGNLCRLRILNLGSLVTLFSSWLTKGENEDDDGSSGNEDDDVAPWKRTDWPSHRETNRRASSVSEAHDVDFSENDFAEEGTVNEIGVGQARSTNYCAPVSWAAEAMDVEAGTSAHRGDHQSDEDEEMRSLCEDSLDCANDFRQRSSAGTSSSRSRQERPAGRDEKFILTWSCPNLLALIFHGDLLEERIPDATANTVAEFFLCLLQRTKRLLYLDLSYWSKVGDMRFLRPQRCLQTLILYDVPDLYHAVHVICSLTTLRHLDICQSNRDTGQYPCPVTTLNKFVTSLPRLTSLDITSTNLASNPTKGDFLKLKQSLVESDIVGLRSLRKPLEYLGVFYCDIAAHYHRIPAKKVAGDANEGQILLAIEQYMKRPVLVLKVLNEAYQIYRFGTPGRCSAALQLMLEAMGNHVDDASIQIAASASIFYIIRNIMMTPATKKRIVNALLTGMEAHLHELTMVRNCCLSLCQFEVPNDLLFDYTRAARLLLRIIEEFQEQMIQRIVVYLLNSMACHVEGQQKLAVGQLEAVERMLNVIRRRHDADQCDEVMEVAWSFLWNITDETPANCDRFLRNEGMKLFYDCYKKFTGKRKLLRNMTGLLKFPDKNELLRNMMGLMGNIAEVKEMRRYLMESDYVAVFCSLLKNLSDGIEISYNSAGVLSHMLSDGPSAWGDVQPCREEATQAVIDAVETWQVNARRFINYRSFEPILRLVPLSDCPASQHWSIWALANLTTVDGPKYCSYVIQEGGFPLLEKVAVDTRSSARIKELTNMVLANVRKWMEENGVAQTTIASLSSQSNAS